MGSVQAKDIAARIAERFIELLEKNKVDGEWKIPWDRIGLGVPMRINKGTPLRFTGVNSSLLLIEAMIGEYTDPTWGTYAQWQEVGRQVVKGESSALVFRPWFRKVKSEETEEYSSQLGGFNGYGVFNYDQTVPVEDFDGDVFVSKAEKLLSKEVRPSQMDDVFAGIVKTLGVKVLEKPGDRACYQPAQDTITMPLRQQFGDVNAFYSTFAHELAHSTGNETRLNRPFSTFGSEKYAFEELVAELTSAMVASTLGFSGSSDQDNVRYIGSWIKTLKKEPGILKDVMKYAADAYDLMFQA